MKRYLRELKPTEFDDVIAMGALYRPGPLSAGLTDSFIKRKNGLEADQLRPPAHGKRPRKLPTACWSTRSR